ncbi:MAG TPA: hypothetical protein VFV38_24565 [Ktedonobacteraceae bacterium]|nr:hypothetical protein [Ktedonobacteraceae bacterium]
MLLLALIRLRCTCGKCLLKTSAAEESSEVLEMQKLSGSPYSLVKVVVASMRYLEVFNEHWETHRAAVVHIGTSSERVDLPHHQLGIATCRHRPSCRLTLTRFQGLSALAVLNNPAT